MRSIATFWDTLADGFDREPDHGLSASRLRAAWRARIAAWTPVESVDALDLGCGTGTLSVLLAQRGHRVTGVDLSARMVAKAQAKIIASGFAARVLVGDAADPPLRPGSADLLLARHVLWTLPDPPAVLRRWVRLLRPGGRLILVEGTRRSAVHVAPVLDGRHLDDDPVVDDLVDHPELAPPSGEETTQVVTQRLAYPIRIFSQWSPNESPAGCGDSLG